jgi:hypothetical protein
MLWCIFFGSSEFFLLPLSFFIPIHRVGFITCFLIRKLCKKSLKIDSVTRFFTYGFFRQSITIKSLTSTHNFFEFCLEFRAEIQNCMHHDSAFIAWDGGNAYSNTTVYVYISTVLNFVTVFWGVTRGPIGTVDCLKNRDIIS